MPEPQEPTLSLNQVIKTGQMVNSLCWSNQQLIHFTTYANQVRIFDPHSGKCFLGYNLKLKNIHTMCWSSAGHFLAVGCREGVSVLDAWDDKLIATMPRHICMVSRLSWSPNECLIASAARTIRLWDVASEAYACSLDGHK